MTLPNCPACGLFLLPDEVARAAELERAGVLPLWSRVCSGCGRKYRRRAERRAEALAAAREG